jgi:hypothetical protein
VMPSVNKEKRLLHEKDFYMKKTFTLKRVLHKKEFYTKKTFT